MLLTLTYILQFAAKLWGGGDFGNNTSGIITLPLAINSFCLTAYDGVNNGATGGALNGALPIDTTHVYFTFTEPVLGFRYLIIGI